MIGKIENSGAAADLAGRDARLTGAMSQNKSGSLNGELFFVHDAFSILTKGQEELSLAAGALLSNYRKSFEDCKVTADQAAEPGSEELEAFLMASGVFGTPEELADLVAKLTSGEMSVASFMQSGDLDPAMQYAVLRFAWLSGQENGTPADELERLEEAFEDLEIRESEQIRAGLNTMGVASQVADGVDEIRLFQSTYRDVVLGSDQSLSKAFVLLMERLGGVDGEKFNEGLANTISAVGADLASARPSVDSIRLEALIQDLYQLSVVSTLLDRCKELASQVGELGAGRVEALPLLKRLVAMTEEKWVSPTRFESLAKDMRVEETQSLIAFHTGVKHLVRDLPVKIFLSIEARQMLLDASQLALDEAIALEDSDSE